MIERGTAVCGVIYWRVSITWKCAGEINHIPSLRLFGLLTTLFGFDGDACCGSWSCVIVPLSDLARRKGASEMLWAVDGLTEKPLWIKKGQTRQGLKFVGATKFRKNHKIWLKSEMLITRSTKQCKAIYNWSVGEYGRDLLEHNREWAAKKLIQK